MKWGRTYQMIIQGELQEWRVGFPFSCRFQVSATGTPTANVGHFYLYNIPEKMRNDILKDIFDDPQYRQISFMAGYESEPQLPVVFVGNVFWAYSYRQGPDWITEINALDGGYGIEAGSVHYVAPAGTDYRQILRVLVQAMPNLTPGIISQNLPLPENARGISLAGQPWAELIKRILPINAQLFISDEVVYILAQNEYIPNAGGLTEISDDTGMIGSPRRQNNMTIATLIFEPRIKCGQKITLVSRQPYAGDHKVMMVDHHGTISPTVCDDAVTVATFFRSPTALVQAQAESTFGVAA
jgi:hypothetical protein